MLIDLQNAIDHPSWGIRNNPQAESVIARLLARWRELAMPIQHVKHDSVEPNSTYRPGQSGNDFKPVAMPLPGEPICAKHTGSAFVQTDLESQLRAAGIVTLVIVGVITNNSVETTVRHAGCLGFAVYVVEDGCFTFGKASWPAAEVHAMSLANLDGEYCQVVKAEAIFRAFN